MAKGGESHHPRMAAPRVRSVRDLSSAAACMSSSMSPAQSQDGDVLFANAGMLPNLAPPDAAGARCDPRRDMFPGGVRDSAALGLLEHCSVAMNRARCAITRSALRLHINAATLAR